MLVLKSNKISNYSLSSSMLGLIGLGIAILSLMLGSYCQIKVLPHYLFFSLKHDFSAYDKVIQSQYYDQIFILGNLTLILATLSILTGFFSILKQNKLGIITLILGLFIYIFHFKYCQI